MNFRKVTFFILSTILLGYLFSISFRAYQLYTIERYSLANNYINNPLVYPIDWYYDDTHREKRLKQVDNQGVYVTNYNKIKNLSNIKGLQYNPVNISLMIIHEGKYYNSQYSEDYFLTANLNWLVENQDEKGRWPITFDNNISKRTNLAPWYSGLAQGLGISALVRGYIIYNNPKYLEAAKLAMKPIMTGISKGGVLSSSKYGEIIEEYPFDEDNIHVLNGYLYSIIGIYELSRLEPKYTSILNKHINTLNKMISEYSLPGGWSAYSLDRPTLRNHFNYANPMYHQLHIAQLNFVCEISGNNNFCTVAEKFSKDRTSIASIAVHLSYIIFKDFVTIYKGVTR